MDDVDDEDDHWLIHTICPCPPVAGSLEGGYEVQRGSSSSAINQLFKDSRCCSCQPCVPC